MPRHEDGPYRRDQGHPLADLHADVAWPVLPDPLEEQDVVAGQRRHGHAEAELPAEPASLLVGVLDGGVPLQSGIAQGHDGGPERVRPQPLMPGDVPGVGEDRQKGMGGGQVDVELGCQVGQGELLGGVGGQEVEDRHGAGGGEGGACHKVRSIYEDYFHIAK